MRFAERVAYDVRGTANLDFYQEMVEGLIIEGKSNIVYVLLGIEIKAKAVGFTNGTFKWSYSCWRQTIWWYRGECCAWYYRRFIKLVLSQEE
jgi:hypothetical protein